MKKVWIWLVPVLLAAGPGQAASFLFDCTKIEVAGDADWVIDADNWTKGGRSIPDRFPTPDQALVIASTPETFWTGGYSSFGIALVKAGHHLETLPPGATITYGSGTNPQDLSNYDVYVIPEPQVRFYADQRTAILQFVEEGGSLLLIADHCGSDRNNNGWDSPMIYQDFDTAGMFGIQFLTEADGNCYTTQLCYEFDPDPNDPFIRGPFGTVSRIGFNGSTQLVLHRDLNPEAQGHAWRNGFDHGDDAVLLASSLYGAGRVAAIGDSSPAEDETGDPEDDLYPGWDQAGTTNGTLILNICHWLAGGSGPAPTPTPAPTATPTPSPDEPWVGLLISQPIFHPGDHFVLSLMLKNPGPTLTADVYLALSAAGGYWFWPGWTTALDFERRVLARGHDSTEAPLDFTWPAGAGNFDGVVFYGVMTGEGGYDLLAGVAAASFGFREP